MTEASEALRIIRRGTEEILLESELTERLKSGRRLRVKATMVPGEGSATCRAPGP